ncbi:hypothetical protein MKX03_024113 [Papaver bracteatum]|nr:hypothetical protein MKX03_024113 [Papaver bracteatum]
MIPHHHIHHGSIDSLLFLKPVLIILSVLMFHTYVCISQENNREGYEKCKDNFVCGNLVDVGYPFWGEHHNTDDGKDRPEYCGLPEYKLDCYGGDIAEIKISQESYHVFHINPEGQVMNITSKDFMDDDDACPAKYPTVNFDSDAVFNRAPDVDLLILHFGCSGINNLDQHKFNCQINNNTGASSRRSIDSYWYIDIPTQFFLSCTSGVSVPVMSAALRDLTTERVPAVIKQGFSASYRSSMYVNSIDACENCKRSGGSCGYNTARGIPTCYSGISL